MFSAGAANGLHQGSKWIVDSGTFCHVCNDRGFFVAFKTLETPVDDVLGDGHSLKAVGHGLIALTLKSAHLKRRCKLHDV